MKIFQAFSLLTIAHGSKVTRINFREGEGLGSRLAAPTYIHQHAHAAPPAKQLSRDSQAPPPLIFRVWPFVERDTGKRIIPGSGQF